MSYAKSVRLPWPVGVAAQWIGGEVNRALLPAGPGNLHHQQGLAFKQPFTDMVVRQQVDAHLLAVVQVVEQLGAHLVDILYAHRLEMSPALA